MILHRFMSAREYEALMRGEVLRNEKRHWEDGSKTTSIGFCFFPEEPRKAIRWLNGIVDADYCVTMDIPGQMLMSTKGRYRDVEKDKGGSLGDCPETYRTEYCTPEYSLEKVKVLHVTREYDKYRRIVPSDPRLAILRLHLLGAMLRY